jgi:hypothetical protein
MDSDTTTPAGHFHSVKFYETPESLCDIVAAFLGEGLLSLQPALVIATPEHRNGILDGLRRRHFDVDSLLAAEDLILLDAEEMLAGFMVNGMPDAALFTATATRAIEQACRGRKDCTTRAYGEMVDVLWKAGLDAAAIRLELFWNKLANTQDFCLLCGYSMGTFYKDVELAAIHSQHSHVVSPLGAMTTAPRLSAN